MKKYCIGPKRSPGATQDSALGHLPGQPPVGIEHPWLNMNDRPRLEFCSHGFQHSHHYEEDDLDESEV